MLGTTWHWNHSTHMRLIFHDGSNAAWGKGRKISSHVRREIFNRHVRDMGRDMNVTDYIQTGTVQHQINPHDYYQWH